MEHPAGSHDSHDTIVHVQSRIIFNAPILILGGSLLAVFMVIGAFIFFSYVLTHWHTFVSQQSPMIVNYTFIFVGVIAASVAGYAVLRLVGHTGVDVLIKLGHGTMGMWASWSETRAQRARKNLLHVDENKVVILQPGGRIEVVPVMQALPRRAQVAVEEEKKPQALLPPPTISTGRELLLSGRVAQELEQGYYLLGPSDDGNFKRIPCKKLFSTIIAGIPRTGKTTTVFWILTQVLVRGGRFFVVDPNKDYESEEGDRGLAGELEALADFMVFPACVGTKQELLDRMRWMYRELLRRKQPGYIVKNSEAVLAIMDEFNSVAQVLSTETVVIVHDEEELNFAKTLALLEREGPKYGLAFMLIGHKWTKDDIGGDNAVRTNATTYLCHKMNDAHQADLLLKGKSDKILKLPVGAYLATGPQFEEHATKIYTPMITARDIPVIRGLLSTSRARPEHVQMTATARPISPTDDESGRAMNEPGQPLAVTMEGDGLPEELRSKMLLVLQMDQQGNVSINKIITEVWGVDPDTRQGRAAKEQLNVIRAYIAKRTLEALQ
jgi:hypothetical protein